MPSPSRSIASAGRFAPVLIAAFALFITSMVLPLTPARAQAPSAPASAETPAAKAEIDSLIEAIRNDETRGALLKALEAVRDGTEVSPTVSPVAETARPSFGAQVAAVTQGAAEEAIAAVSALVAQASALPARLSALSPEQIGVLTSGLRDVALALVATYAILFLLRALSGGLRRRIGRLAAEGTILRTVLLALATSAIDGISVVLAWAAGYAITLTAFGEFGTVGLRQTLYLNAFLAVELARVVLRFVLSPEIGELRLMRIDDAAARYLARRFSFLAGLIGYGQLFVVPIFTDGVSSAAGQAISFLVVLAAIAVAATMAVSNRHAVSQWLVGETTGETAETVPGIDEPAGEAGVSPAAAGSSRPRRSGLVRVVAQAWLWLVLTYLAFLLIVVMVRPADELLPVLGATLKVAVAIVFGIGISGWLSRAIVRGIRLPDNVNDKLPLLERRLNAFVPKVLTVLRGLIVVAILAFTLDAVGILDLGAAMRSDFGVRATGAIVSVAGILVVAFLLWLALTSWIDFRLNPDYGTVPSAREQTLLSLLRNAATIAILVITLMFALSEIGIDIAPLIASAGVLGLAIGFGAQKLVQDIITGIFIQLENAFNVGDVVTAGATTGTVERLTIRSVGLRDVNGTYHIVPFSSVDMVSNFMRGFSYHVCDMGVAYREDYDEVREAMFEAYELLRADPDHAMSVIGDMEWFGIQAFGDNAVIMRSRIKTAAGKQWGVGRAYNVYLKKVFDRRNIEIPFPHQTIYFGEDRKGEAPAARIRLEGKLSTVSARPRPARRRADERGIGPLRDEPDATNDVDEAAEDVG